MKIVKFFGAIVVCWAVFSPVYLGFWWAYVHNAPEQEPEALMAVGTDSWFSAVESNLPPFKKGELNTLHECDKCGEYSVFREDAEYGVFLDVHGYVERWVIPAKTDGEIEWSNGPNRQQIMKA